MSSLGKKEDTNHVNNKNMSKEIIEINGVKLEVDTRYAKRVDQIRIGTRVKVLQKDYSDYKVAHGIVIGFEPFQKLPTIIVAAAIIEYSTAKIKFIYYNSETKDTEIVISSEDDVADVDKNNFINSVDREIDKKKNEIQELEDRKQYFLKKFKTYWEPVEVEPNKDEGTQ